MDARERLHTRRQVHGAPTKPYSSRSREPIRPASPGPRWMPTPKASGGSPSRPVPRCIPHGRAHGERGAHCVVALPGVGLEGAEVGEDAVAEEGGDVAAMLVDGIAHALEVAVEHARQHGGLQPLAQRGVADEVGEQRRHHLALGDRRLVPDFAVGDQAPHDPGRRQPRAGLLELLQFGGGLELGRRVRSRRRWR